MNKRMKSFNKRKAYNQVYHKNKKKKENTKITDFLFYKNVLWDKTNIKNGDSACMKMKNYPFKKKKTKQKYKSSIDIYQNHERKNKKKRHKK